MSGMFFSSFARAMLPWLLIATGAAASTLEAQVTAPRCGATAVDAQTPPAAAAQRIPDSQAVSGSRNIAWAWLGTPSSHYAHAALGSTLHARSLHALVTHPGRIQRQLTVTLPADRVFEDRTLRLADLEGDGGDQIIVVESDPQLGSALVVYGLRTGAGAREPVLASMARGPFAGKPMRWLNPVGAADFDGDGRLDLAAVTTPHMGGVLTLYRYEPPRLQPVATLPGVSNHRNGTVEQQLAAIVQRPGRRPALIIPGNDLRRLHAVRLDDAGQWKQQAEPLVLPSPVQRLTPLPSGACVLMTDGITVQVRFSD
ncbi:FG-GAP repeat domain-containing protein [Piscinibacter koreensis]|uniref:VCBS repeat-containing protein n=1 Tax=Piscinibacter koreensis TaxID=2742824 RepID=A0A7Y6NRI5_9BURK|nr:VCBS repeat-containing protein [Schlegelella koreensis]NUZ07959.1 VCBS repeat-containing protein [Schlegelella koreensis]